MSLCSWIRLSVFETPGHWISRVVVCCYRTGRLVLVLDMQVSLRLFMPQGEFTSQQRLQRSADCLGWFRYALWCNDCRVVQLSCCACVVACCYRAGWLLQVLDMQLFLWLSIEILWNSLIELLSTRKNRLCFKHVLACLFFILFQICFITSWIKLFWKFQTWLNLLWCLRSISCPSFWFWNMFETCSVLNMFEKVWEIKTDMQINS